MTRTLLALLAAFVVTDVSVGNTALAGTARGGTAAADGAGSALADDPNTFFASTLQLEFDAFNGILGEMKDMIESSDETVPADVKRDHKAGKAQYQHAKELYRRGDTVSAYKEMRRAWATHRPATDAVLRSMPRERLDRALQHLFSVVDGRVAVIDGLAEGTSEQARTAAREGKRLYAEARSLSASGKELAAAEKAFDALHRYDEAVHLAWADQRR